MGLIGISGKISSGKDTVGKIIQYLTDHKRAGYTTTPTECDMDAYFKNKHNEKSYWKIVKFADKLKDIVCILTGCTREQLEDSKFKNSLLSDEWIRYGYANGFYRDYEGNTVMNNVQCDKERYERELITNWQTAYKSHLTYRELLQYLGTDLLRSKLHTDVWVNALMSEYRKETDIKAGFLNPITSKLEIAGEAKVPHYFGKYPNWIITDMRFPNELTACKENNGITIRLTRVQAKSVNVKDLTDDLRAKSYFDTHPSETALDNAEFDYIIDNDGSIEELIVMVKEILIKEKILMP